MSAKNVIFYDGYEAYFDMVENNDIFSDYCNKVFGIDFSQDGFSDLQQVNDLIKAAHIKKDSTILDIGCGNGKMMEYISDQTGAIAHGFDYSKNAIMYGKERTQDKSHRLIFDVGIIDEVNFLSNTFDAILSVDTLYFTNNMTLLIKKIYDWLRPNGVFTAFYGEGHLKEKNKDMDSTDLAVALKELGISYKVVDYTKQHYELMKHKRKNIIDLKDIFEKNNMKWYYEASINQSIDIEMAFEEFAQKYNRFMYQITKHVK